MNTAASTRRMAPAGTVLSEMIFVMPLLLVILSLVFYIGMMSVRVQHASVMARYETWRQVTHAPGPYWDPDVTNETGNAQLLNETFYGGKAEHIGHTFNGRYFAEQALDGMVNAAGQRSGDAAFAAENILFRPPNDAPRLPYGHREGFRVEHSVKVPLWRKVHGPIRRRFVRMDNTWPFVDDWLAGPDTWKSRRGPTLDYLRGVRDAFFGDFDAELDAIDGERDPEYGDYPDGPQHPNNSHLAGAIRRIYLSEPKYRGPIVHDELEQQNNTTNNPAFDAPPGPHR